jgi:hypothetical protein
MDLIVTDKPLDEALVALRDYMRAPEENGADLQEGLSTEFGWYEGLPPVVTLLPDGRNATLDKALAYYRSDDSHWPVPVGAALDGASIPRFFWTLIGGPFEGKYRDASIVHDHYCVTKDRPWPDTHRMFHDAMRCSGVGKARAGVMFYAVYRFGPRWPDPALESLESAVAAAETIDDAAVRSFISDAGTIIGQDLGVEEIAQLARARDLSPAPADAGESPVHPSAGRHFRQGDHAMIHNPVSMIESADVGIPADITEAAEVGAPPQLDLTTLPDVVVSGTTLIDFSGSADVTVRSSVSLAMLFASRVATAANKEGDDEDDWLARYNQALTQVGFRVSGHAVVQSRFKKKGVEVHQAIIPFLTMAFGGAAVGPVILQALQNLQEVDPDSKWITLFDRQTRRFDVSEMHFAAVGSTETETTIRYAVARLHVETGQTNILFFKITSTTAEFESTTTSMTADNGLLAAIEPRLQAKLLAIIDDTITGAKI